MVASNYCCPAKFGACGGSRRSATHPVEESPSSARARAQHRGPACIGWQPLARGRLDRHRPALYLPRPLLPARPGAPAGASFGSRPARCHMPDCPSAGPRQVRVWRTGSQRNAASIVSAPRQVRARTPGLRQHPRKCRPRGGKRPRSGLSAVENDGKWFRCRRRLSRQFLAPEHPLRKRRIPAWPPEVKHRYCAVRRRARVYPPGRQAPNHRLVLLLQCSPCSLLTNGTMFRI